MTGKNMTWSDLSHQITVADLRAILDSLDGSDVLYPNRVGNLSILRNGSYTGVIDLLHSTPLSERLDMLDKVSQ